jgi:hypothetical protein
MRVFLSWSGSESKQLALALRDWIPLVLQYAEPWMSDADIPAGERWANQIGKELEQSRFGIICVTKANISAPWILFEAGALAKSLEHGAVCPFIWDLTLSDLSGPLAQFQAKKVGRAGTLELLTAINARSTTPIPVERISKLLEALWPQLEVCIQGINVNQEPVAPHRNERDVLEELVATIRSLENRFSRFERLSTRTRHVQRELIPESAEWPSAYQLLQTSVSQAGVEEVATEIGITPESLRNWLRVEPGTIAKIMIENWANSIDKNRRGGMTMLEDHVAFDPDLAVS